MGRVIRVNELIREAADGLQNIAIITHPDLTAEHLVGDRHLKSKGPLNAPTALELLVNDMCRMVTGNRPTLRELKDTYRKTFRK